MNQHSHLTSEPQIFGRQIDCIEQVTTDPFHAVELQNPEINEDLFNVAIISGISDYLRRNPDHLCPEQKDCVLTVLDEQADALDFRPNFDLPKTLRDLDLTLTHLITLLKSPKTKAH